MLPPLGRLSLNPAATPAPTGEFYELSEQEAAELNADGGREALTYDDYVPNRARGQEGATFRLFWDQKRVFKNPPGHRSAEELAAHGQSLYAVYDAKALWDWVKTHEKDPTGSFQITYEDWMELFDEYSGNIAEIPEFVARLPSVAWPDFGPDTVWVYQESGVHDWNNKPWTGGRWVATVDGAKRFRTFTEFTTSSQEPDFLPTDGFYLSGPPGEEKVTKVRHGKWKHFYKGPKGHEQLYKTITPRDDTKFYATDEEPRASRRPPQPASFMDQARGRLIRAVTADGLSVWHYKGPKNHERVDYVDTDKIHDTIPGLVETGYFTGRRRAHRCYKVVRWTRQSGGPDGLIFDTHYLRGAKGHEVPYKRVGTNPGGWVAYYETGEEDRPALRRVEHTNYMMSGDRETPYPEEVDEQELVGTRTTTWFYEGPLGSETYVRSEMVWRTTDGVVRSTKTERPEDYPAEMRERVQRISEHNRRTYSAWAPVRLLEPAL